MKQRVFRPSGPLHWFMKRGPDVDWSFCGCLSPEERSTAAFAELSGVSKIHGSKLLCISDKRSRFTARVMGKTEESRRRYLNAGGSEKFIQELSLFSSHAEIVNSVDEFVKNSNGSIVLDISSLPKRFFFPFVRWILTGPDRDKIDNFVVTYTSPRAYTPNALAEDFNDWSQLPLFGGDYLADPAKMLIVAAGFESLGLHEQLKGESDLPIKLLLPFPAPPSAFKRSWELIRQLRQPRSHDAFEVIRVAAGDCSDTFDQLCSLTVGDNRPQLAPFGPKPVSLGMCLFAVLANCEVFYTQPAIYHPDYSVGVADIDGTPAVTAFAIRLNGKDYYGVPG